MKMKSIKLAQKLLEVAETTGKDTTVYISNGDYYYDFTCFSVDDKGDIRLEVGIEDKKG
jgi:hypothetical protein